MKRTFFFMLLATVIATSCSKGTHDVAPASSTCTCTFRKNPMKDSTIKYSVPGTGAEAKNACDYKQKTLASQYSNTACNLH